ncbi:CLOCK-interacting pacemaker [Astyanax mexicanus]|uniref:CLOCK-interacting pacemaker n=1 Tax=Astyanax mexicanus TaxID=7994 RepID=UPI0020CB0459|nr:CLOCK-interacting pacemaker [Astyanax mexicanus]XP_007230771.3 CLOCK-interacting pacemaker [Astyanax mexicanus]
MSRKMKEDVVRTVCKSKTKRLNKNADSERDSGFSDAGSEHLSTLDRTDAENATRTGIPAPGGSQSQPSQLAVMGGSFQSLSPMIFMNNVLLKQPGENPNPMKPWGFSPAVEVVQQPQVVFLQPVVSQRAGTVPKGPASKRRRHKKYLPILKSYPKIAPHPGDSPRSNCTSNSSSSSSTTASVKSSSSSSSSWDQPQQDKQQCLQSCASSSSSTSNHLPPTRHVPASPQPHPTLTDTNTGSCPGVERPANGRLELTSASADLHSKALQPRPQAVSKDGISESSDSDNSSNKRKRFCNTYNILSKSGLLDITLRTKELIRQNRRTQTELDQLREHTNLFMEVLQTGDLHVLSKLQLSMQQDTEKEKTNNNDSETQIDQLE